MSTAQTLGATLHLLLRIRGRRYRRGDLFLLRRVEPGRAALRSSHASDVRDGEIVARREAKARSERHPMRSEPSEHAMRRDFLSKREGAACNREIRKRLGQALRATYEPALSQTLPEHLADLVERLRERQREGASRASAERSSRPA